MLKLFPRNLLSRSLSTLFPFVLGGLVTGVWHDPQRLLGYSSRLGYIILAFGVWYLARSCAFASYEQSSGRGTRKPAGGLWLPMGILALVFASSMLLLLQGVRQQLTGALFTVLLLSMGFLAARDGYGRRGAWRSSVFSGWIADGSLGYLSFLIVEPDWYWQPVLLAFAVSSVSTSARMTSFWQVVRNGESGATPRDREVFQRALLCLTLLGPSLITPLLLLEQLPLKYVLLFVAPISLKRTLQRLGESPLLDTRCEELQADIQISALTFLVLLMVVVLLP